MGSRGQGRGGRRAASLGAALLAATAASACVLDWDDREATELLSCGTGKVCNIACAGGATPRCLVECATGSTCNIACGDVNTCDVDCATGATCNVDCTDSSDCSLSCSSGASGTMLCAGSSCLVSNSNADCTSRIP